MTTLGGVVCAQSCEVVKLYHTFKSDIKKGDNYAEKQTSISKFGIMLYNIKADLSTRHL